MTYLANSTCDTTLEPEIPNNSQMMKFTDRPNFPHFHTAGQNILHAPGNTTTFNFLPTSWNLLKSFKHYYDQQEFWSTPSIDKEFEDDDEKKMPAKKSNTSEESDSNKQDEENVVHDVGEVEAVEETHKKKCGFNNES